MILTQRLPSRKHNLFFLLLLKPKIELGRTSWSRDNLLIPKDDFLIRRMEENVILRLHHKFDPNEERVVSEEDLVLIFYPPLGSSTDEHAQLLPIRRREIHAQLPKSSSWSHA